MFPHLNELSYDKLLKTIKSHDKVMQKLNDEMEKVNPEEEALKKALDANIKYYHWNGDFKVKTCSDMFNRIFGTDPNPGTMSAGLLKESIFNEIINMYNINNEIINNYLENLDINNKNDEFKSAVALVVFKLLMTTSEKIKNIIPTTKPSNKKNSIEKFVNYYSFADLLLHDNVHFCKAVEIASDTPNIKSKDLVSKSGSTNIKKK